MAITFVGSGVGTHAATSAQTYNFSSLLNDAGGTPTLAEGDIVYVAVENSSTVNRGAGALVPSGYTAAHTADYRNDSNDSNFQVSYKVMGATPDTSVSIPASNATTAGVAYVVYVFRGVDTTTPHDATPVVAGGTNTGIANASGITPVTAGAWVAAFGGAAVAAGAVFTNPTNMDTTTNYFRSTTITSTTNDANVGGSLFTGWTSGTFTPNAFGGSTSTNTGSWSAVTIALKPYIPPDYSTTALSGSFTYTGSSVDINVNKALTASSGSYAYTGSSVDITWAAGAVDYPLTANSGSYSYTGSSITAVKGRSLTTSSGAYTYTGSSVVIKLDRSLTASSGAYNYTGSSITITKGAAPVGYTLTANAGSYTYTGTSVSIAKNRDLTASSGNYTYTGSSLEVVKGRVLTASQGNYAYTGSSATLTYSGSAVDYPLTANTGTYVITGSSITVTVGSAVPELRPRGAGKGSNLKKPQRRNDDDEVLDLIMALVSAEYI